jgi:hypothetical protein
VTNNTTIAIENAAKEWSKLAKEEAQRIAPKHISPFITSSVSGKRSSGYTINLGVKVVHTQTTDGTDDAWAQEYGSGVHAGRGTYPIKAIRKKALAFITANPRVIKYSKANRKVEPLAQSPTTKAKAKSTLTGNIVLVRSPQVVKHPGIAKFNGVGYLHPAAKTAMEVMSWAEAPKIAKAIRIDIVNSFKGKRK